MLALLMTHRDDYQFRAEVLQKQAGIGRDKFQKIMRELMTCGYVKRQALRGESGMVAGSESVILDDPHRPPESPAVGTAKHQTTRKNIEAISFNTTSRKLVSAPQVRAAFSISEMTLWRWLNEPAMNFPKPIHINRRRYFRENEIADWVVSQEQIALLRKAVVE